MIILWEFRFSAENGQKVVDLIAFFGYNPIFDSYETTRNAKNSGILRRFVVSGRFFLLYSFDFTVFSYCAFSWFLSNVSRFLV